MQIRETKLCRIFVCFTNVDQQKFLLHILVFEIQILCNIPPAIPYIDLKFSKKNRTFSLKFVSAGDRAVCTSIEMSRGKKFKVTRIVLDVAVHSGK
jgi:hypothetical protein